LFSDYKIVIIVRDPRQWAASYMNTTSTMYGPKNLRYRLGINLFSPTLLGDMEYGEKWNAMNRFEKLCWAWQAIYSILLKELGDEHVLLIKFEDIFLANNRYNELERLLIFLTTFPSRNFEYRITKGLLENPINRSTGKEFPKWQHWDPAQAKYLHSLCSPLMEKFGYGHEKQWLEMVQTA
ncbi:MAG: sulfotransferase domain-containing protein, partial [Calditrichota bacterium]